MKIHSSHSMKFLNDLTKIENIEWNLFLIKSNVWIFVSVVSGTWQNIDSPIAEDTQMFGSKNGKEPAEIRKKVTVGKRSRSSVWRNLGKRCSRLGHQNRAMKRLFYSFLGKCQHRSSLAINRRFLGLCERMGMWRQRLSKLRYQHKSKQLAIWGCWRFSTWLKPCPWANRMSRRQWMDRGCAWCSMGMSFWNRSTVLPQEGFFSGHRTSFCSLFAII